MKKIFFILISAAMLASCQKADHNGELGGYWKLKQIELNENDSIINKREESRFWAIQLKLIQIGEGKGRFQHVGDSLYIQMITNIESPNDYGIFNQKDERFKVVQLENRKMVLRSKEATLSFIKF